VISNLVFPPKQKKGLHDSSMTRLNLLKILKLKSNWYKIKKKMKYLLENRIFMFFPDQLMLNYLVALRVA